MSRPPLARRLETRLHPDPRRVVTRLFVPGEEMPAGASRSHSVISRIVALDDAEVSREMRDIDAGFAGRHRDLAAVLREHSMSSRMDGRNSPGFRQTAGY